MTEFWICKRCYRIGVASFSIHAPYSKEDPNHTYTCHGEVIRVKIHEKNLQLFRFDIATIIQRINDEKKQMEMEKQIAIIKEIAKAKKILGVDDKKTDLDELEQEIVGRFGVTCVDIGSSLHKGDYKRTKELRLRKEELQWILDKSIELRKKNEAQT